MYLIFQWLPVTFLVQLNIQQNIVASTQNDPVSHAHIQNIPPLALLHDNPIYCLFTLVES